MKPYILMETSWKTVKNEKYQVAVLPWGATEAHNYHLPFGTDNFESEMIANASAKMAWDQKAKVIVLPTIPIGVNTGQTDIKLTLNLRPSTQLVILKDIVERLLHYNIFKLLIVNGHGGNDFKQIIREVGLQFPEMLMGTCNWYQAVDKGTFFENSGDHADEMETSLMLYLKPELVLPLHEAGKGTAKKLKVKAFNENWAWTERKWSMVSSDTGIGDPQKATKEKGKKYFEAVSEKLADLIVELARTDKTDFYI